MKNQNILKINGLHSVENLEIKKAIIIFKLFKLWILMKTLSSVILSIPLIIILPVFTMDAFLNPTYSGTITAYCCKIGLIKTVSFMQFRRYNMVERLYISKKEKNRESETTLWKTEISEIWKEKFISDKIIGDESKKIWKELKKNHNQQLVEK